MHRRHRPVMTRTHRLNHVKRLRSTDLANDDPVGPQPQSVADQLTQVDRTLALGIGGPTLEADDMAGKT